MTLFECVRLCATPILPPLAWRVRKDLQRLSAEGPVGDVQLLDIGARRSPYTIGLPCQVTLLDVPRTDSLQQHYDLGVDDRTKNRVLQRRSNVRAVRIEDFVQTTLPSRSFTILTAIEVIEHVSDDETFVRQLARVCAEDGFVYLTTPNGDFIPKPSPQHIRHYRRAELEELCSRFFSSVEVRYGLEINRMHKLSHDKITLRRPFQSLRCMFANVAYKLSASRDDNQPSGTAHLIAVLRQPK